jgi:hypothetical protein
MVFLKRVCLVIIYNHHFPQNIERLENIYSDKFSHIFHLVPFYRGAVSNVIPVYEKSHQFQGYIAQAFPRLAAGEFDHYFFVADDMILNPRINQDNYDSELGLSQDDSFLTEFISLHETSAFWKRVGEAFDFSLKSDGVDITGQLPSFGVAKARLKDAGLYLGPLRRSAFSKKVGLRDFYRPRRVLVTIARSSNERLSRWIVKVRSHARNYNLSYPLVGGYSDIFVVTKKALRDFSHYCGAFAAGRLFVELAIPTALVLSSSKVVTEKDIKLSGRALWGDEIRELDVFRGSLQNLLDAFPADQLYLHPVKLSEWN